MQAAATVAKWDAQSFGNDVANSIADGVVTNFAQNLNREVVAPLSAIASRDINSWVSASL